MGYQFKGASVVETSVEESDSKLVEGFAEYDPHDPTNIIYYITRIHTEHGNTTSCLNCLILFRVANCNNVQQSQ